MTQIEQWIREEGREEGRMEGREEGKKEIVLAALKKGLKIEDIADITGLTKDAILKIKEEHLS